MQTVVVETPSGKLQGLLLRSSEGDDYYAFKGVPYAKPPVGQLRFQDPVAIEPWTDIRDATSHGPICCQYDQDTKTVKGSEDCLYLNVYTRCLKRESRAPVMLAIHGGAFIIGSGDDDFLGPDYLMNKEVVLVTFNYRLGVLGFLNLEDKVAPGNQGLKDQVMVLKWIKSHITHFGGDPDNVTIFGGSAGGASVHYLTMSPLARGLFHKAISQSGCALNPWAVDYNGRKSADQFLAILECEKRDPEAIVDFLRTVDCQELIEAQGKLISHSMWFNLKIPFLPGIDDKSVEPFLSVPVSVAAQDGVQVPFMIGYTGLEGMMLLEHINYVDINDIDSNTEKYLFHDSSNLLQKKYDLTIKDLRHLYFKSEEITEDNLEKFIELWGDIHLVDDVHRLVKIQHFKSGAPTYLYKFTYDKNLSLFKKSFNVTMKGANHGDELFYLFKANICKALNFEQLQESTGAERLMKQMIELWVNFAKTGRPTPVTSELIPTYWQPIADHAILRYLNIDEELRMEKMLNIEERYSCKKNCQ